MLIYAFLAYLTAALYYFSSFFIELMLPPNCCLIVSVQIILAYVLADYYKLANNDWLFVMVSQLSLLD